MFINIRKIQTTLFIFCCGVVLCLMPKNLWSQPKSQKKSKRASAVSKSTVKQKQAQSSKNTQQTSSEDKEEDLSQTAGGKVIEFSQFTIEGTIPRPSAAYLLQRRKLKFRGLTPKKSFLPALFKSVERPPF